MPPTDPKKPIKLALLGCGTFAKDAYIPLVRSHQDDVFLVAAWSRSEKSVREFVTYGADVTSESQVYFGDGGLKDLLRSANVDAVAVVLPVHVSPEVIMQALAAGKHVLSEKPIAGTTKEAMQMLQTYHALSAPPVWNVAENYRYEPVFSAAADLIPSLGSIVKMDFVSDVPMNEANKYFGCQWRRNQDLCPGGFIMDFAVHFTAAMRMLAEAAGAKEAVSATSYSSATNSGLPAPDTTCGNVIWDNGLISNVSIALCASMVKFSLAVTGTEGSLEVMRGGWYTPNSGYTLAYKRKGESEPIIEQHPFHGMPAELEDFVAMVRSWKSGIRQGSDGTSLSLGAPEKAFGDLAIIQSIIQSGNSSGRSVPIQNLNDL